MILFLVLYAFLGTSASAQEMRCESLKSNNAQSECYYEQLKVAEAEMQPVYEKALSLYSPNQPEDEDEPRLPQLDMKIMRENRQRVIKNLKESQRLWLAYRDKSCEAIGDTYMGGTISGEIVPVCKTELTKQRTEFLRDNFVK